MDPAGTRGPKVARRPHGRVAVLVTVLVAVLAAARVGGARGAGGERARPGFSGRLRTAAFWTSSSVNTTANTTVNSSVSSGTRGRKGRGAGRARGERARPGFSGRLREKHPRRAPDPGNGLKTPAAWGAVKAEGGTRNHADSWRNSPQSQGIYGRPARVQPAVRAGRPDPGCFPGNPPRNPRGWAGGGVGGRRKAPARPPRPPQEAREADMRGEGIEKAKGPRSGMPLRGEDEPPRGGRHRPQG
jgi:hypothetical protein